MFKKTSNELQVNTKKFIEIIMPALSPTMNKTGGKIVRWLKKEGDKIRCGEVIAEIETDKSIMEMESSDSGVMAKVLVPEGASSVPVKQVIAVMVQDVKDISSVEDYVQSLSQPSDIVGEAIKGGIADKKIVKANCKRIKASPLAKVVAEKENIDLKYVKGTGPYGRIIKSDVFDAKLSNTCISIKDKREGDFIELSSMRKVIAQRLLEAKQTIPHFYLTIDCQIDKLLKLKEEINSSGNKITINDFIIKAAALSMKKFPDVNVSLIESKILKYYSIDISVAVALEDGLITPIVKDVNRKSISIISKEVKDLVNRAKSGKLRPEEFQGGGVTISNLGMFGVKQFNAIINPPQSCIIAVGASEKKPIVVGNKIEIATMLSITLSVDHRTVDGVLASKFLNILKYHVEAPIRMLLE